MIRTLLLVLAALCLAAPAAAQVDPFAAQLDRAKQVRISGDLGGSEQIVRAVLASSPGHFRANYTLGLIQLDRGQANAGRLTLTATVDRLKGQPAPDPTIYNTLGWVQMRAGQFDKAEASFKQGYAQQARLTPASRQKLLNNMALLSRLRGRDTDALKYTQEAVRAGSPQAQTTLGVLQANRSIQGKLQSN
ncbi:hypothetical protein [Phenylobacterium sp.]|uniref:tetratricopeptide repeat protein n=1 Tax=Phenylobacterium sp. TaxID=1871053 RepID=UPI00286BBE2B|nr:hypothetical protein [Phenylobacterium sp.]